MGCCGSANRPQRIRKQVIEPSPAKQTVAKEPIQRKLSRGSLSAKTADQARQHIIPREQCVKCGFPGMVVHISGRERMQCSNVNCRTIIT